MASATTTYNFTDEEVSHLANCNTQDDFLFNFQRILQTKGIDVTAVFDTQNHTWFFHRLWCLCPYEVL